MGNVLISIKSLFQKNQKVRICMFGLDGVGKTSLLYNLKGVKQNQTIPTIGFNVENCQYGNIIFETWDIGGGDMIKQLWHNYFVGADAIIFVVDSSDKDRLPTTKEVLYQHILNNNKFKQQKQNPLLIYLNKSDLSKISENELMNELQLQQLQGPWYIQESCAITGKGVIQGLMWLSQQLKK